eukprot:scaffold382_cov380-Prasinococcus_capsulatus_cf.AAC.22
MLGGPKQPAAAELPGKPVRRLRHGTWAGRGQTGFARSFSLGNDPGPAGPPASGRRPPPSPTTPLHASSIQPAIRRRERLAPRAREDRHRRAAGTVRPAPAAAAAAADDGCVHIRGAPPSAAAVRPGGDCRRRTQAAAASRCKPAALPSMRVLR